MGVRCGVKLGGFVALSLGLKTQMDEDQPTVAKKNGTWIKIALCVLVMGVLAFVLYKSGALKF